MGEPGAGPDDGLESKLRQIRPEFVERGARAVTERDLESVVQRAAEIRDRFTRSGPLGRFLEDGKLLVSIVRDYWAGRYRSIPYGSVAASVVALLYVLNPVDVIPDVLPVIGHLDDAAVLSIVLLMIEQDLQQYREWKIRNPTGKE